MRSKEFREIQVSSSTLVFIILGVLVLGVFIFLLGISVGKKQAQMTGPSVLIAERVTPPAPSLPEEGAVKPDSREANITTENLPSTAVEKQVAQESPGAAETRQEQAKTVTETRKAESRLAGAENKGLYYIQVGAFAEKSQATGLAEKFKKEGYSVIVLDPLPTDKRTIFRVRLGGYATNEQASQVLAQLNSSLKKKSGYYLAKD